MRFSRYMLLAFAWIAVFSAPSLAVIHEVSVQNFSFSPADLAIEQGDTVRWIWVGGSHSTTSGDPASCEADGLWDAPLDLANTSFEYTFNDVGVFPYFCRPHCLFGMSGSVTVEQRAAAVGELPLSAEERPLMLRIAPTPASNFAVLAVELTHPQYVRLVIFDAGGRRVATVADRWLEAGSHQFEWDGRSDYGTEAPAGVYYVRMPNLSSRSAILVLVR